MGLRSPSRVRAMMLDPKAALRRAVSAPIWPYLQRWVSRVWKEEESEEAYPMTPTVAPLNSLMK